MKNLIVRKYNSEDYATWNAFITDSKNGTFLFHRDFMTYHADRFQDYSLIIESDNKWIAVLPANINDTSVFSHQGLTYGGLIYSENIKLELIIVVFEHILKYLSKQKITILNLKTIPSIYHKKHADELLYALFLAEARLIRRDSMVSIDLSKPLKLSKDRKEGIKKGLKNNLIIKEESSFDVFWKEILEPNLHRKHNLKPVHSLEEISKLKQLFPNNIRQFNVYQNETIVAGTTIFESDNVAHSQYIGGTTKNNENGSLDFLHHHLLTDVFKNKAYFDFGNSNEQLGKKLNAGLSYWKESFGASCIVQDFYEVPTSAYLKLSEVII